MQLKTQQPSKSIDPALVNFDQMPPTAMIRPKSSALYLGISIASLWRAIRRGDLKAHKITERTTGIMVKDLRAFVACKEGV